MKNHIKRLLQESGMRQRALADATGISESHISLIISGQKQASQDAMGHIARALNRPLGDVFEVEGMPGFGDSHAEPWQPQSRAAPISRAVETLRSQLRKPLTYRARIAFPTAGVMPGDLLICETSGPYPDGLVLVTVADTDTAESHTELRRKAGQHLISLDPMAERPVLDAVIDQAAAILGAVFTLVRPA